MTIKCKPPYSHSPVSIITLSTCKGCQYSQRWLSWLFSLHLRTPRRLRRSGKPNFRSSQEGSSCWWHSYSKWRLMWGFHGLAILCWQLKIWCFEGWKPSLVGILCLVRVHRGNQTPGGAMRFEMSFEGPSISLVVWNLRLPSNKLLLAYTRQLA